MNQIHSFHRKVESHFFSVIKFVARGKLIARGEL